jgi:hypothetical protein
VIRIVKKTRPLVKTEARFSPSGAFECDWKTLDTGSPVLPDFNWGPPCANGPHEEALKEASLKEIIKMKVKTINNLHKS